MNRLLKILGACALLCGVNRQVVAFRVAPDSFEYGFWMNQIAVDRGALKWGLASVDYAEMLDRVDGILEMHQQRYLKRRLGLLLNFYQSSFGIIAFLVGDEEPRCCEKRRLTRYAAKIAVLSAQIQELDLPTGSITVKRRERCKKRETNFVTAKGGRV